MRTPFVVLTAHSRTCPYTHHLTPPTTPASLRQTLPIPPTTFLREPNRLPSRVTNTSQPVRTPFVRSTFLLTRPLTPTVHYIRQHLPRTPSTLSTAPRCRSTTQSHAYTTPFTRSPWVRVCATSAIDQRKWSKPKYKVSNTNGEIK